MNATKILQQGRQPLIRFLGKRSTPSSPRYPAPLPALQLLTPAPEVDHTPHVHPASPSSSLPESFASYRQKAQQHGPLNQTSNYSTGVGSSSGSSLGPVEAGNGFFFDRSELPARFQRMSWSQAEIDAIESGGASQFA
jgi:small subunit ribosomal protein YMR-31